MELAPFIVTLKTASTATFLAFFIGIGLAYAVVRMRHGQGLADAVITLPMVLPPTVVGFFLLLLMGKRSTIGQFLLQFDVSIVFTWKAAVISAVIVSMPLMYRTARGAFEQIDQNILNAARTLGVSEWKIFWHLMIPNAKHGILAGAGTDVHSSAGRVRRDDHVRGQCPERDANHVDGDLFGGSSQRL